MEIKKLGFGLMRLPYSANKEWGNVDIEKSREMIDAYLAEGFSYFDTAWIYHGGFSEKIFGELVAKRYPRNKFQVTSKMPVWEIKKEEDLSKVFEAQLKNCCVDYFDYYFLHSLDKHNYEQSEKLNGFDFVKKMKKEGKIKHIGFSFHGDAELLDKILSKYPEMELIQLQINYIDWESDNVQSRKCYEVAMKHKKIISIMEPVKGGSLANPMEDAKKMFTSYNPNASVASWAIRYAASLDNVLVVLSGMSNMEQLKDNMSYMKDFVPLNNCERDIVKKAANLIKSTIAIGCTGCRYCTDGCPKSINIPRYFELYNEAKRYGVNSFRWHYNEEKKHSSGPGECVKCHSCEKHCPQKLKISDLLGEVNAAFESKSE